MKPRHVAELSVLIGVSSLALYFVVPPHRRAVKTQSCQSNLKQIGLGMLQYIRDYDERTPLAANWAESMRPYMVPRRPGSEDEKVFHFLHSCPTGEANYALNRFFAKINYNIKFPETSVMVFDSTSPTFATSDFGASWPRAGVHTTGLKSKRGNNVLFVDGHVELVNRKPKFARFVARPQTFFAPKVKR
jgi:prepilin-type processing-associated H-X9-DG protein